MNWELVRQFLVILPVLLVSLAAHELAHAASATVLGDPTPRAEGRVTLNPIAHLDVFGTLMLVLTYFVSQGGFFFGWAKPVHIDPRYLARRRGSEAIVAVSGPATNFLLAVVCGALVKVLLPVSVFAAEAFYLAFMLNVVLAVLNILPVPPLDGWRVVTGLLPQGARSLTDRIAPYETYVFILFFVVLWRFPQAFSAIFEPPLEFLSDLLFL